MNPFVGTAYYPSLKRQSVCALSRKFTHPLDNKKFITTEFHQTYEHHISVVSTWSSYGQVYQLSYYNRVATITNKSEVLCWPQSKGQSGKDRFDMGQICSESVYTTISYS